MEFPHAATALCLWRSMWASLSAVIFYWHRMGQERFLTMKLRWVQWNSLKPVKVFGYIWVPAV